MRTTSIVTAVAALLFVAGTSGCAYQMPLDPADIEAIEVLIDPEPRELDGVHDLGRVELDGYLPPEELEMVEEGIIWRLAGEALRQFPQTTVLHKIVIFPRETENRYEAFGVAAVRR